MKVRVLMITHDRPTYTRLSLCALCDSLGENGKVVVWDNASTDETRRVLKSFEPHPRVEAIIYSPHNAKLNAPTNWFWTHYGNADFLGKVDDDCLLPRNWCAVFLKAHHDIAQAGAIACWHFLPEDFNETTATRKITRYGDHAILRNCWVNGSGYLLKRRVLEELGLLDSKETFTDYCIRAAAKGFVNGWYFPFLYQAHLDDPRVQSTGIKTDADFSHRRPLSAQAFAISTREDWIKRLRSSAQMLQACSANPADYIGVSDAFSGTGCLPPCHHPPSAAPNRTAVGCSLVYPLCTTHCHRWSRS